MVTGCLYSDRQIVNMTELQQNSFTFQQEFWLLSNIPINLYTTYTYALCIIYIYILVVLVSTHSLLI